MAQNTLKQKARLFAQKHDLPYATALRAVNEPLHELREISRMPERELTALHPHFRLTGEQSIYASAFPDWWLTYENEPVINGYSSAIRREKLFRFESVRDLLKEMGRRVALLEAAGVDDFWSYRELQRAGALTADALPFEPLFHHYGEQLPIGYDAIILDGPELGVFAVSTASFLDLRERVSLLPVTRSQLEALREGKPVGKLRLPPIQRSSDPYEKRFLGDQQFSHVAFSKANDAQGPRLTILFREDPLKSGFEFSELGLDTQDFKLEVSAERYWQITQHRDMIRLFSPPFLIEACSERVLEI